MRLSDSPGLVPPPSAIPRRVVRAVTFSLVIVCLLAVVAALTFDESARRPVPIAILICLVVASIVAMVLGWALIRRESTIRRLEAESAERQAAEVERTLAEVALAVDQERFAALIEHSHDAIAVLTPDARTLFVSDAITRLTGRTPADLMSRFTFEHVHPDDLPLVKMTFANCVANPGQTTRAEFRVRVVDGHHVWLEAIGTNHLENPAVGGVVVNIRDVTERRLAEDRLRDARSLLEFTGRLARIGGWEYLIPDDRLTWSEQTYRIHDLSPGAYVPTVADAINFYAPEARPVIRSAIERAMASGASWNLVLPFVTDAGRNIWVNAIGQVEFAAGVPYRLFGTFQDVTERVETERAVERSEARYRNLFESAPVAIWEEDLTAIAAWFSELREAGVTDLAAHLAAHPGLATTACRMIRVHDVNRAAVVMNRATDKSDLIGNLQRLFTPDTLGAFADELVGLWNGERTLRVEGRAMRLDGAAAEVVLHLRVPEVGGEPDFGHVVVIILDVTDQKRLEEQFRQSQKLEAIGRLAGGIAHDFNNLLTVINGFAELILAEAAAGSTVYELTTHIRDAGNRAADLTRQLLAFSRKQPVSAGLVDLPSVVTGLTPLLSPLLAGDVRLESRLAAVPLVRGDKGQIESVVMNLVINARDAMPNGGTLTLATTEMITPAHDETNLPQGRWVVLSVSDTGTGIPVDVRPHLFEPFFTTKELGKGTGLGLPTAYGIVTSAGGHLRYDTTPGEGTTFRIYLPVTAGETEYGSSDGGREAVGASMWSPQAVKGPTNARVAEPTSPLTVLLVEDLPAVRNLAAQILSDAGFAVTAAEDGPDALNKLASLPNELDVLVTDIQMPGMNGRELAVRVRTARPSTQVLFISGFAPEETRASSSEVAGEAFLPKPFGPDELINAVRTLADRKLESRN